MWAGARRLQLRYLLCPIRRALLIACVLPASQGVAQSIASATYTDPTTRYAHGILGDAIEHASLAIELSNGRKVTISLPRSDVFEDTEPRLIDMDEDGTPEVLVVQSNQRLGAKLAIYDETGLVADIPYIGRSNRWLAPLGAADLDGDGAVEVAYIDRPHLAKTLRIWRFEAGELTHVTDLEGFTNHRIGERDIAGGIRNCDGKPEIIVASADWTQLWAITFDDAKFDQRLLGHDTSRPAFAKAMACTG
ncbi:MAG: hypothetical protein ACI9KK_000606 [Ascidiaceihabitans sp.]|jgi:hypothetical protein